MPASAKVSTNEQSRVFSIDVDKLHKFLVRNPLIRHALEGQFANQLGEKLRRANQSASTAI
jgi:CRP-like cAMP-binding protein